jgi:1-deoxy-D-xylulose-5-phosphate synthase
MAAEGFIPVVAIYSTFLQRAYDQIIHDVCIQKLPVVFAIDRAGIVGDDGRTHQGVFDVSYLRSIPNMIIASPKDENELQHILLTAVNAKQPMALRYPRGCGIGVPLETDLKQIPIGKAEIIKEGQDLAIISLGSTVFSSLAAAEQLAKEDIYSTVVNARFAKPLDSDLILDLAKRTRRIITVEENALAGGFGNAILELLTDAKLTQTMIECLALPDKFIEHGPQEKFRSLFDLDSEGIIRRIRKAFPELTRRRQKK